MTKKMTKTVLITVAAVVLLAAMALAIVFGTGMAKAATLQKGGEESGNITVTYTVAESWKVSIPENVKINKAGTAESGTVSVSDAIIGNDKDLVVKIQSANGYTLQNGDDSLTYTVKIKDSTTFSGSDAQEVLKVEGGTKTGSAELEFNLEDGVAQNAMYSGDYTDQLTFTVSVEKHV